MIGDAVGCGMCWSRTRDVGLALESDFWRGVVGERQLDDALSASYIV
jgi:hypothetical protein